MPHVFSCLVSTAGLGAGLAVGLRVSTKAAKDGVGVDTIEVKKLVTMVALDTACIGTLASVDVEVTAGIV